MTALVVAIFALVYLGMLLGGLPFLQLDRSGVALLGAIALLAAGAVTPEAAARSVHLPTLILLFSFMVISAQLRLGGFYTWITRRIAAAPLAPPVLLAALMAAVAALSAVFSNDIVCLAMAPVLADLCIRRGLDPVPFLLALACAANIGSAATLIGNPQNMLIGETLHLSFAGYARTAALPVVLALATAWAIIAWRSRGHWDLCAPAQPAYEAARRKQDAVAFDRWQSAKGLAVAGALLAAFLFARWPREVVALTGAGVLMTSRKLHSTKMLGLVDWQLLVLFIGLFVVNHALQQTGLTGAALGWFEQAGTPLHEPAPMFVATFALSNLVSNVPAVMLLLPAASEAHAGAMLALVSTFAGNLILVGSIANIIVVDAAARRGVVIGWRTHARIGAPVTLAGLVFVWAALAIA